MPIAKSINTPAGVAATFWVVSRAELDFETGKVWVLMKGYLSADAQAAGMAALMEIPVTVAADKSTPLFGEVLAYLESVALGQQQFAK